MSRAISSLLVLTLVGSALAVPHATAASLAMTVTDAAVDIGNVPPRGAVVLLMCARTSYQGRTLVERRGVLLRDDDGDGRVRYSPPTEVPIASVWVAVDFATGELSVAAHPDFPLSWTPLPPGALPKDSRDEIAFIEQELPRQLVFVVRPDVGVWEILGRDGRSKDRDGSPNGKVKLAFEEARTIEGREKAPKHLKKDDVVVAINPGHLGVLTTQVGR